MWNLLIVWAPLPLSLHYPFLHPAAWNAPTTILDHEVEVIMREQ